MFLFAHLSCYNFGSFVDRILSGTFISHLLVFNSLENESVLIRERHFPKTMCAGSASSNGQRARALDPVDGLRAPRPLYAQTATNKRVSFHGRVCNDAVLSRNQLSLSHYVAAIQARKNITHATRFARFLADSHE